MAYRSRDAIFRSQVAQQRYTVLRPIDRVNGEAQNLTPCNIYTP